MYKLVVFIPEDAKEDVKHAIFSTGAGHLGNYSDCSFETKGIGQFRPLKGSNPTIGTHQQVELVHEVKVEILCSEDNIKQAINAMIKAHPYEEVAYEVYKVFNLNNLDD